MTTFTISAAPGTDIWRKPPHTDVFDGMQIHHHIPPGPCPPCSPSPTLIIKTRRFHIFRTAQTHVNNIPTAPTATPPSDSSSPTTTTTTTKPLQSFLSVQASFSFPWSEQYDQAGLLLTFRRKSSSSSSPSSSSPPKWIKTGIEYYNGQPQLSTVACETWADWSVTPLTTTTTTTTTTTPPWTTIAVDREADGNGSSLWVYHVLEDGRRVPLREICWVYGDAPEDWLVEVSAMAARPEKKATANLEVSVRDMVVKWAE